MTYRQARAIEKFIVKHEGTLVTIKTYAKPWNVTGIVTNGKVKTNDGETVGYSHIKELTV